MSDKVEKKTMFIAIILILSISLIIPKLTSASFLDNIFGRVTQPATVTISVANNPPVIGNITLDMADNIAIVEGGNKSFKFSFVVTDQEGSSNIDNTKAFANISRTDETTRYNDTRVNPLDGGCRFSNLVGANGKNFSCGVNIVFYDGAGLWTISTFAQDTNSNSVQNITKTFTILETTAIQLDQSTFAFNQLIPNQDNITSSTLIGINNTGNDDILSPGTINISVTTLVPSLGDTFIPASNFSMGTSFTSSNECDTSLSTTTRFLNTTDAMGYSNFTGSLRQTTLPAQATGNRQTLELCLIHAPSNLISTTYSTIYSGPWNIIV